MQAGYDEVETRGLSAVAVAQEDTDLASHAKMLKHFHPGPRFEIVADLGRKLTQRWDRATIYAIDAHGVVNQVYPQLIHHRASWSAILRDMDLRRD